MTTKQKHTPTPWQWYWVGNRAIIQSRDKIIINTDDKAEGTGEQNYGIEEEADAKYIVKCVNAHEELVDILKKSKLKIGNLTKNHNYYLCKEIEAVLKKAGE